MQPDNFLNNLVFDETDEVVTTHFETETFWVERITSSGQTSDWYEQDEDEWVMLLSGEAELELADGTIIALTPYSTFWFPKYMRHRVAKTSKECIWLCIFLK